MRSLVPFDCVVEQAALKRFAVTHLGDIPAPRCDGTRGEGDVDDWLCLLASLHNTAYKQKACLTALALVGNARLDCCMYLTRKLAAEGLDVRDWDTFSAEFRKIYAVVSPDLDVEPVPPVMQRQSRSRKRRARRCKCWPAPGDFNHLYCLGLY